MPTPRHVIVDESKPGLYHVMSRCVRRAHLCGDGFEHRRDWIQERIETLASVMAIDIYAWDILSNHLHVLLAIRPDLVAEWSDQEVVRRYLLLCPGKWRRRLRGIPVDSPPTDAEINDVLAMEGRVSVLRSRMSSLSWCMARLKEPISRRANREDDCTGHFWEGRFRSIAVLDEAAILAVATYIDLNSVRAGIIDRIEASRHGSVGQRAAIVAGRNPRTRVALQQIPGFTNEEYLRHVDAWARCVAPGQGASPPSLPSILERLGVNRMSFGAILKRGWDHVAGTAIGAAASLAAEAERRAGSWVVNPLRM
jgi:hypothetical protein